MISYALTSFVVDRASAIVHMRGVEPGKSGRETKHSPSSQLSNVCHYVIAVRLGACHMPHVRCKEACHRAYTSRHCRLHRAFASNLTTLCYHLWRLFLYTLFARITATVHVTVAVAQCSSSCLLLCSHTLTRGMFAAWPKSQPFPKLVNFRSTHSLGHHLSVIAASQRSTAQPPQSEHGSEGRSSLANKPDILTATDCSEGDVAIKFASDDVSTMAKSGENLWAVAQRCGVSIPLSCGRGDCGSCEMEVKKWKFDGSQAGTAVSFWYLYSLSITALLLCVVQPARCIHGLTSFAA